MAMADKPTVRERYHLPGPRSAQLLDQWHRFEADVTGVQAPVVWDRALGCVVWDVDGNSYLDWTSGVLVANVGHCHPHLVRAIKGAAERLLNNYECANVERIEASRRLVQALPEHLSKCFFLTTGGEATEAAARLMKRRTGKFEVISFQNAWHGRTSSAASMSGLAAARKGYGPTLPGIIHFPFPNPYRDPFGWCESGPGFEPYFEHVEQILFTESTGSLAGLITEPYQGAGGFVAPPKGWLKALERWAREKGILFTLDEVQSSYGRTGMMWAMEHEGLKPDIVAIGKAIGCGMPVSAVAATEDVFSCMKKGEMSSTMGGNPLAGAAVCAVLDIFDREDLVGASRRLGDHFLARLKELGATSSFVGDVRGIGLALGVELVRDKESKEPFPEAVRYLIDRAAEYGLLIGGVGRYGNVIRVAPPLVMTREEADESLGRFRAALVDLEAGRGDLK